MRVSELIEKLQQLPQDYRVILESENDDDRECSTVILGKIDDYTDDDMYHEEPVVFVG